MKIKIKSLIISFFIGIAIFNSCTDDFKIGNSFLEKAPGTDMTIDSVFGKAEYARNFLWNTYSKLYFGLTTNWSATGANMNLDMFECLSDCYHSHLSWGGISRYYYSGQYDATMENDNAHVKFNFTKENCWEAIRQSWIFIENIDRVPDMDNTEKDRLKAEAEIIIASRYFDMFRHFGGLPKVDHAYAVNENMTGVGRMTVKETTKFMTDLLDKAASTTALPWVLSAQESSNWDGRLTRASAMGLKCKILLFTASPLFNDNTPYCTEKPQDAVNKHQVWTGGYDASLWEDCLKSCEDFFRENSANGSPFYLIQATGTTRNDYRQAFRKAYRDRGCGVDNPEMLISTRTRYNMTDEWSNFLFYAYPSAYTPTLEYVDMFPLSDGTPFDWNNPAHVSKFDSDRDPRLYETILINNAPYYNGTVGNHDAEMWVGGIDIRQNSVNEAGGTATGFQLYKYMMDRSGTTQNLPIHWPYLRVAEIHLIYAEALMKAGRLSDAASEINKIRNRVGLNNIESIKPSILTNATDMLSAILNERACELGFEDVRFFDMIRHKMSADFKKQLHGLRIWRADGINDSWIDKPAASRGPRPSVFRYEKFPLQKETKRVWWQTFSTKWFLSALPPNEINKGYGLTQNPGW